MSRFYEWLLEKRYGRSVTGVLLGAGIKGGIELVASFTIVTAALYVRPEFSRQVLASLLGVPNQLDLAWIAGIVVLYAKGTRCFLTRHVLAQQSEDSRPTGSASDDVRSDVGQDARGMEDREGDDHDRERRGEERDTRPEKREVDGDEPERDDERKRG